MKSNSSFVIAIWVVILGTKGCFAFECFTCNAESGQDDTRPCVDKLEKCPEGVFSCSMVMYTDRRPNSSTGIRRTHLRKFCTSAGTPIYQYLLFFPGSSLCQNINTVGQQLPPTNGAAGPPSINGALLEEPPRDNSMSTVRFKRVRRSEGRGRKAVGPPAPPHTHSSSLLCVCSTPLCNAGEYSEVLQRSMLHDIGDEAFMKADEVKLEVKKIKKDSN